MRVEPEPIAATPGDLPAAVARALAAAPPPEESVVDADGIRFATLAWGRVTSRPLLLVHGVTASARTWWRIGPALAAAGFRVVAPDLPGHGLTGQWRGRHTFRETAEDLAALARATGLARPDLAVVGHSWGAMTTAALPEAGLRPAVRVLVDPPVLSLSALGTMTADPVERRYDDVEEAAAVIRGVYPSWTEGDIRAKAEALASFEEEAARAILLDNGDWDGGLSVLAAPAARGIETWVVRGEPSHGAYVPDEAVALFEERVGRGHVLTILGGPHSPHRTHPEATLVALLRALGAGTG